MKYTKLCGIILTSFLIYSCQQPNIDNGMVILPTTSPSTSINQSTSSPIPTTSPSIINIRVDESVIPTTSPLLSSTASPIPTVTPTPSSPPVTSFPCTRIGKYGKNFSIKCSYSADMYGAVRNKSTKYGVKATIKIERDGKTNIIQTSDNGSYEISSLFFGKTYQNYGTYKFTVSAPDYVDLVKEVNYADGGLDSENPINFDMELVAQPAY